jgi:hypothetical protein
MKLKGIGGAVAIAALTLLWSAPAMAGNIVWNGGFDQGALGWPRGNTSTIMIGQTIGGQTALGPSGAAGAKVSYQLVDAAFLGDSLTQYTQLNSLSQPTASMPANELGSANPGWIPASTSETYSLSYQYYLSTAAATAEVRLYYYTGAGTPPYDVNSQSYNYFPLGVLSPNWTLLYDSAILTGITPGWVTVSVPMGTIPGDPRYFGIILNSNRDSGVAGFDSISLSTQSAVPVPEPASMLLLGTGLVGMVGAARRRMRK